MHGQDINKSVFYVWLFIMFCICLVLSIQVFRAKELLDNTLALIKNAMSGAIVDPDRLVIGTEEGLFCLDLDHSGKSLGIICQNSSSFIVFHCSQSDGFSALYSEGLMFKSWPVY